LGIFKQPLDRDKALPLVVYFDAFGLRVDIARNFKRQHLAQSIEIPIIQGLRDPLCSVSNMAVNTQIGVFLPSSV
jgi:hypothetical protein